MRKATHASNILIPQKTWICHWKFLGFHLNRVTMELVAGSEILWGVRLPHQPLLNREITRFYFWCQPDADHVEWNSS